MPTIVYPMLSQPWGAAAAGGALVALGALLLLAASWKARAARGGGSRTGGRRRGARAGGGRRRARGRAKKGRKAASAKPSARVPLIALPGLLCVAGGLGLAFAGTASLLEVRSLRGQHPPPGRLVDVGGHRMHILAEGEPLRMPILRPAGAAAGSGAGDSSGQAGPTEPLSVVWIPGGHAQGLALHHLHSALRDDVRSIIFDRPGTGWSDPGPFPRRTATEAEELATLLERAGEQGRFVLAGHSYGGLLAANFARRHPNRTAALVLLDASPPDAFVYAPAYGAAALEGLVADAERQGLAKALGRWENPEVAMAQGDGEIAEVLRRQRILLADVLPAMEANQRRPSSSFATASIFREFGMRAVPGEAPRLVVYDGELGDLPVLVVVPDDDGSGAVDPLGLDAVEARRARNFFQRVRLRYLEVSSNARLVHTPLGTGHNYPYETPDFVAGVVRELLAELAGDTAPNAAPAPDR